MKITKKQPLRPRGRSEDKRQSTKNVIRDAYINGPQKEVQIIPAKRDMEAETEKKKLRVCAYCRVSTDEDTQASSYELQVQNYTRMIRENPEWEFAGIFADEYNQKTIQCYGVSTPHKHKKTALRVENHSGSRLFVFIGFLFCWRVYSLCVYPCGCVRIPLAYTLIGVSYTL